jgi:hypothetical protein
MSNVNHSFEDAAMHLVRVSLFTGLIALVGCYTHSEAPPAPAAQSAGTKKDEAKTTGESKKVPVGKNVTLEVLPDKSRRVLVNATVCLREGTLEQLLTRARTKEHEAILAAEIDARDLHTALLYAGAEEGKPVSYDPKFTPPTGTTVKVFLEYLEQGQKKRVAAQEWIRNTKTKKALHTDWVFAGSRFDPNQIDPESKKPYYAANIGDVICISNFDSALLDVPFNSPKDNDDLTFEAHTARIPPEKTAVTVVLEPVLAKKK